MADDTNYNKEKTLEVITTDGRKITLNTSDETCKKFGFLHGDIVVEPSEEEAKIMGVAPGNDGEDVLWYEIIHSRTKGTVCYWGGSRNLQEDGFRKKNV